MPRPFRQVDVFTSEPFRGNPLAVVHDADEVDDDTANAPWVAAQGTALGRAGRVRITRDADGTIWTGGSSVTVITGEVEM